MIKFQENKELSSMNTLGVPSIARYFFEVKDSESVEAAYDYATSLNLPVRVLGSGSNLILADEISAFVVSVVLFGRSVSTEAEEQVTITVGAGENWHSFVLWTVEQGYSGLENLALIPGTVGACPVQNIGAYGVEVGEFIKNVDAYDSLDRRFVSFSAEACQFGYRDSVFKREENRYLITSVTFALNKKLHPVLNYGPLKELTSAFNLNGRMIFERVCQIRQAKLPDPKVIPNAGSFFKNPVVTSSVLSALVSKYPNLVYFPNGANFKLAAGWLIEQAGLKGASNLEGVGCFSEQSLVIVNPNRARSGSVLTWASFVQKSVQDMFGVVLEIEPRIWN